jgi:hypothetical protein
MNCRHCAKSLVHTFLDLGFAPPSNAYLSSDDLTQPEKYYPLKVKVCHHCWLVQTEDCAEVEELFTPEYAYFSSTSTGWLAHAKNFAQAMVAQLNLDKNSYVIEVASNDGYLLKNFVAVGIPCLGIEPTAGTAAAAVKIGVPVIQEFFNESLGKQLASEGRQADLIIGNNVYAHVPDINDFTRGLKSALKHQGTITLEFPHIMKLIAQTLFDTVYHEHFSYLSLCSVSTIFQKFGLRIWDVEQLSTHGGSLRVFGCHLDDARATSPAVTQLLAEEAAFGLQALPAYLNFQSRVNQIKDELLEFLIEQKRAGKKVVAYGAAAKGNTLLNYAGVKHDLLAFVCDAALAKQGKYMPGSHIPILPPQVIRDEKPDFVLILPWNIATEVLEQNSFINAWGGQFVVAIPTFKRLA